MVLHQTNLTLLTLDSFKNSFDKYIQFGYLLAAFGHDIDHTG